MPENCFKNHLTPNFQIQNAQNGCFFESILLFSLFKELLFAKTIYVLNVTTL